MAHHSLPRRLGTLVLGVASGLGASAVPGRAWVGCGDPFERVGTVYVPYPRSLGLLRMLEGEAQAFPPARRDDYPEFVSGEPAFGPREAGV